MKCFSLLVAIVIFNSCIAQEAGLINNQDRELVFQSVNIIPMDEERVISNQTLVVKNGKITHYGDKGSVIFDKNAFVIDAKGKYIIPGWSEMHAHIPVVNELEPMEEVLMLYLANGITTIRGMLGNPMHLQLREQIRRGEILGPNFSTSGPPLNGHNVTSPEKGAKMVREQKEKGYDFLKIHPGIKMESFASVAKIANAIGIPMAGHVPFDVGVWNAIDAKFSSIDHLDGFVEAITPASSEMTENEIGLFAAWIATKADSSLIPKLMGALQANSIYVVPTEALAQRWLSPFPASSFEGDPELKYMSKEVVKAWIGSKNNHNNNPRFNKEEAEAFIKLRMKLINDCQRFGVKLLLGSDAPQIFNVPGFSIHREMQYMVNSGLTPYETLLSGTVNVASYLNKNDSGTIKPGNVSDFVLLNSNPLVDISNTKDIEGVMIGTQWLSKEFIDKKLEEIEMKYQ